MIKKPAIIVDIDGTLMNTSHRQHYLEKTPKDWGSFFANTIHDTHNEWCEMIICSFRADGYHILFVSGREERYRHITYDQIRELSSGFLKDYGQRFYPLFMRQNGDFRCDTVIKEEIYNNTIRDNYNVLFCIDDRPKVCRMWRGLGLTVLQCNDKEF